jgi:hypothetical protein
MSTMVNKWWCETCILREEMSLAQIKSHLKAAHDYDATNFKGLRKMIEHIDSGRWFSSRYQWTLNHPATGADIELTQCTVSKRTGENKKRHNNKANA